MRSMQIALACLIVLLALVSYYAGYFQGVCR